MKMLVYFPSSYIYGDAACFFFFEDSFFLPVVQESNTIQSNKRLYKAYTYHSLKFTWVQKHFTTSGHSVILK